MASALDRFTSCPISSECIDDVDGAWSYFLHRIAGAHRVTSHGRPATIVIDRDAIHLFSVDDDAPAAHERVTRRLPGGRVEVRRLDLARAHLLDEVVGAVACYTVSVPGDGRKGAEKVMLHGPRRPNGTYLRVVVRPGPGDAWTVTSAYPVAHEKWLEMTRAKRARFPP